MAPTNETGPPPRGDEEKDPHDLVGRPIDAPLNPSTLVAQRTFEAAFLAGAIAALRKRSRHLREQAQLGTTEVDSYGRRVIIVSSEARAALNIANDWDANAAELEGCAQ